MVRSRSENFFSKVSSVRPASSSLRRRRPHTFLRLLTSFVFGLHLGLWSLVGGTVLVLTLVFLFGWRGLRESHGLIVGVELALVPSGLGVVVRLRAYVLADPLTCAQPGARPHRLHCPHMRVDVDVWCEPA